MLLSWLVSVKRLHRSARSHWAAPKPGSRFPKFDGATVHRPCVMTVFTGYGSSAFRGFDVPVARLIAQCSMPHAHRFSVPTVPSSLAPPPVSRAAAKRTTGLSTFSEKVPTNWPAIMMLL